MEYLYDWIERKSDTKGRNGSAAAARPLPSTAWSRAAPLPKRQATKIAAPHLMRDVEEMEPLPEIQLLNLAAGKDYHTAPVENGTNGVETFADAVSESQAAASSEPKLIGGEKGLKEPDGEIITVFPSPKVLQSSAHQSEVLIPKHTTSEEDEIEDDEVEEVTIAVDDQPSAFNMLEKLLAS